MLYLFILISILSTAQALEIHVRKPPEIPKVNTDKISRNEIDQYQYHSTEQVLASIPGIAVPQASRLGEIMIWGNRSGQNLVIIDGVPQFNSFHVRGDININDVNSDSIGTLTVDKGVSALMQPGSMGGVVNITSDLGYGAPGTILQTESSQYGSMNSQLKSAGELTNSAHLIGLSHNTMRPNSLYNKKHDTRVANGQHSTNLNTVHQYQPNPRYQAYLKYQLLKSNLRLNDYSNELPILSNHNKKTDGQNIQLKQTVKSSDLKKNHMLNLSYYDTHETYTCSLDPMSLKNQVLFSSYRFGYYINDHLETFAELSNSYVKSHLSDTLSKHQNQTFAQLSLLMGNKNTSHVQLNTNQQLNRYNKQFNPQISGTLKISDQLKLKGGIGCSSRGASLYEHYGNSFYAIKSNDHLKSEQIKIIESQAIYTLQPQKFEISLRFFRLNYGNIIELNDTYSQYINVHRRQINGLENIVYYKFNQTINVQTSYTNLNVNNYLDYGNNIVQYIPRHKLMGRINWHVNETTLLFAEPSLTLSESNHYNNGHKHQHNYFYLRLGGQYQFNDTATVMMRIENATRSNHENCYGYGAQPLSVYVGCRIKF